MIWLLRFSWAGRVWYLAQEPVVIADPQPDGTTKYLQHAGTLDAPDLSEMVSWGTSSVGTVSTSVTFRLDLPPDRDVAYLHFREGHRLETATAELSLWAPGEPYAARVKQITGPFIPDRIPLLGRPMSGTLTQRITTTANIWPPATAQATVETWPNLPVDDEEASDESGFPYPTFIGAGGFYVKDNGNTARTSCIQGIYVDTDTVLISYGHMVSTTAYLFSVENEATGGVSCPLSKTYDELGQPVTTADISATGWIWATGPETDTFYVTRIDAGLQSIIDVSAGEPAAITGLGEAILFLLLQRYAGNAPDLVDISAWETARPYLDQMKIGLLIPEGTDPLDIINNTLLPMAPACYLIQGPKGLRPALFTSPPPYECLHLVAHRNGRDGPDLFREPDQEPELVMGDPVNDVTTYFAKRLRTGDLKGTITISPDDHPGAFASATIYGARAAQPIEAATYDRETAGRISGEVLRLYSRRATWDCWACSLRTGAALYVGQRVRVTDELAGYYERPMSVSARQIVTGERGQEWLITMIDF